ncbi:MAG: hypothetical protein Sylvanvirus13_8 [Sylvanvirus sp.]|uniref:dUTPase-like domain-containing protein n=1 Tax=Sylvanvirus sp. TaxID=2487774 RepID=A0A3G5AJV3_9VIRU|nr:MAG: hypothetical protein Sylvanvirus13_8 [Sylvanvirus sp.]
MSDSVLDITTAVECHMPVKCLFTVNTDTIYNEGNIETSTLRVTSYMTVKQSKNLSSTVELQGQCGTIRLAPNQIVKPGDTATFQIINCHIRFGQLMIISCSTSKLSVGFKNSRYPGRGQISLTNVGKDDFLTKKDTLIHFMTQ